MGKVAVRRETDFPAVGRGKQSLGIAAVLMLFALSPQCLAAVYKCTGPDGKLTYGDVPCAADEKSQQVTITPVPLMNSSPHTVPALAGTKSFPATRAGSMAASDDRRSREA